MENPDYLKENFERKYINIMQENQLFRIKIK